MKRVIQIALLLPVAILTTGCATPYLIDRGRDAADVFTAAVGIGGGAKVRVGPLQPGIFLNSDLGGLRAGVPFVSRNSFDDTIEIVSPVPFPSQSCKIPHPLTAIDNFRPRVAFLDRGKEYTAIGFYVPFIVYTDKPSYYTELECAFGIGATVRLGFNPGELLDFLLGWFRIDLYDDDLEMKRLKETSNQVQEGTTRKLADPQH